MPDQIPGCTLPNVGAGVMLSHVLADDAHLEPLYALPFELAFLLPPSSLSFLRSK